MNIKKYISVFILFSVFCMGFAQTDPSIQILFNRLAKEFTPERLASDANIQSILSQYNDATGQFNNINYTDTAFQTGAEKRKHVQNIKTMVLGYINPENTYYQSKDLFQKIQNALDYWIKADLKDKNWWHRSIGFPKMMMEPVLLISKQLEKENKPLFDAAMRYLLYTNNEQGKNNMQGANGTDVAKFTFAAGVMTNDKELIKNVINQVNDLIIIQNTPKDEGIQPDYSFTQHTGNGRQLYLGGYGVEYLSGIMYFLGMTAGTNYQLAPEKIKIIEDFFLNGIQWMWYKNHLDLNQYGRGVIRKNNAQSFSNFTQDLAKKATPQQSSIQTMSNSMKFYTNPKMPTLTGNNMFWRHDYMIQRNNNYFVSNRMTSTRTVGNEAGNAEGMNNYFMGDGATYILVLGDEYEKVPNVWDWKKIPGATIAQNNNPLIPPMWGKYGQGNNDFAGGVSTGKIGTSGFIYDKNNIYAHKAWFYFDGFFVALGAGITTKKEAGNILTIINQKEQNDAVSYAIKDGKEQKVKAKVSDAIQWIYDGQTGYVIVGKSTTEINVENKENDDPKNKMKLSIFYAGIDHGANPKEDTYEYIVFPGTDKKEFLKQINTLPYKVIQNTINAQIVESGNTTECIFYKEGTYDVGEWGKITIAKPSALILEKNDTQITLYVSNPKCESNVYATLVVEMNGKYTGKNAVYNSSTHTTTINIDMPKNEFSGSTVKVELKK